MSTALPRPAHCVVMGVLNVTPDSFSDGGCFADTPSAVAHVGYIPGDDGRVTGLSKLARLV